MNRLPAEKRAPIIGMMMEGMSIRAITRMTGVSKNTIAKLLADAGRACAEYQDRSLRELPCKRLQLDVVSSFIYAKAKNVPDNKVGEAGDVRTRTAIDASTKLIASWFVGDRSGASARIFVSDLASCLTHRVQITTEGHKAQLDAVERAFGADVDCAILEKIYAVPKDEAGERRYSPSECVGTTRQTITGKPDKAHISTSYAERANLSLRMALRRFARLTNAFSKKFENHVYALAIYFMHYNFVHIHQTTRVTPAMAAGATGKLWALTDIVRVVDEWEANRN